ncbi:hypothetical protein CO179_05240 [candidate division WWE3 bacterium CG_4_9_14_3_um_filter_39_7]|uniref:Sortase n=1 Tax=candidate division WWE3 bacterium CG_4_9_14_3_um_filter_39_7 TaxID=1975080 RepID=A0A2M7X0P9_UNCKA|nr:MAG: hypothetical protein CO179_05240 [candidate division WWE3 bacterium CG_4_9_14_3_um_filter_39_7]
MPSFIKKKLAIRSGIVVLCVLAGWFSFRPFIPAVSFYFAKQTSPEMFLDSFYADKYQFESGESSLFRVKVIDGTSDRLIVPSIGVDIETFFNEDQNVALSKGAWVVPGSVNPGDVGEMVITGHRFEVVPPAKNTFYNLDKLHEGDTFMVIKDGYAYKYEIRSTEIVDPEEYNIGMRDTKTSEVTLYTCTPLWTASQRLLQHGELVAFN